MNHAPTAEEALKAIPLFSLLEPKELADVAKLFRLVSLSAGQVLFRQNTPGDAMWVLGPGAEVEVSAAQPGTGREAVIATVRDGETLGEMAFIDEGVRSGTAVVKSPGPARQIRAIDFQGLRRGHHPGAFKVLRQLCKDLCRKLRATSERIAPSSPVPVARTVLPSGTHATLELLDSIPFFRQLPHVVRFALTRRIVVIDAPGVMPVFAEGEQGDSAYFIVSGEVTIGRHGRTLSTLGPGSMFGMVSLLDGGTRSASCVTTGPARLLRLEKLEFDALFSSGNRFAFQVVDLVCFQLVAHLRAANALLGAPPASRASSPAPVLAPVSPLSEEDLLPEGEILPLELEIDVVTGDESVF